MTNYSICYLDSQGRTESTQFLPFEDHTAAAAYARIGVIRSAIVEVWKGENLITRLYHDAPQINLPGASIGQNAEMALGRAERKTQRKERLEEWDNEGGATRRQPPPQA